MRLGLVPVPGLLPLLQVLLLLDVSLLHLLSLLLMMLLDLLLSRVIGVLARDLLMLYFLLPLKRLPIPILSGR
jgi:hypothetical protein